MVKAFLFFLQKKQKIVEVTKRYQRVRKEKESIEVRIKNMTLALERKFEEQDTVSFSELLPVDADRFDVTLSFMSLLSMIKEQNIDANQDEVYGEIIVRRKNDVQ